MTHIAERPGESAMNRCAAARRTGAFGALLALELSRSVFRRRPQPGKARQRSSGWLYSLLVLLLAVHWLAHSVGSAATLVLGAWDVWYVGLVLLGLSIGPGIVHRGSVDYWLSCPFPRWQLVLAKWLAIVWSGLKWLLGVTALATLVWVWALHVRPEFVERGAGTMLFLRGVAWALAVLPAGSAFTLLPLAFQSGWGRSFRWVAPVLQWGVLGAFMGLGIGKAGWAPRWTMFAMIWLLSLASFLLVCARMSNLAAWSRPGVADGSTRRGLRWMKGSADKRIQNKSGSALSETPDGLPRTLRWMERVTARPTPSWLSLALLFLQRDRWFGSASDPRMSMAVVMLPLAETEGLTC